LVLTKNAGRGTSERARKLVAAWSNELFRLASDLPPDWNRAAMQKNALESLSLVDAGQALAMLKKIASPSEDDSPMPGEDLRAYAAQTIFPRYWQSSGASALPTLQAEAREIGRSGEYPYLAMSRISSTLAEKQDFAAVRAVFREALDFYANGPRVRTADRDFLMYLDNVWKYLPDSAQREAVSTAVEHLTRPQPADPKRSETVRVVTTKGTVEFQSRRTALLYQLLPKVRQISTAWAERIEEDHPEFKQAAASGEVQYTSAATVINPDNGSASQVSAAANHLLEGAVLDRLREQAAKEPSQAIKLLPSVRDPEYQAEAMAALAIGFANAGSTSDIKRSAELFEEARKKVDSLSDIDRLAALPSLVEAAAARHDNKTIAAEVELAFQLGPELLREDLDTHPGQTVYESSVREELAALTRVAAQSSFGTTIKQIDHLKDETLEAYMLAAAAEGLRIRQQHVER
jgi:hypothetical protein